MSDAGTSFYQKLVARMGYSAGAAIDDLNFDDSFKVLDQRAVRGQTE